MYFGPFYLAGMAIFSGGSYWLQHTTLVHLFGFNLPMLMMITAFIGKVGKWDYVHILGLFFLIFTMYFTANLGFQTSYVGAMHPIMGIFLLAVSTSYLYRSSKLVFKPNRRKGVESI